MTAPVVPVPSASAPAAAPARSRPWLGVAVVATLFAVIVLAALISNLVQARRVDPLTYPPLVRLKNEIALHPKDEALKERYRVLDNQVRGEYFGRNDFARHGAWMLLAGVVLAVGAFKLATKAEAKPFDPRAHAAPDPWRDNDLSRHGLTVAGVALMGGLVALALAAPPRASGMQPIAVVQDPPVDPAAVARNWATFRGPNAGVAPAAAPTTWDAAAGRNVLWKQPLPQPGINSAVVWDDAVFCTGSDGKAQEVYAFASADGSPRWTAKIPVPPGAKPPDFGDTGNAAPSAATNGNVVVALFGTGALATLSAKDGKVRWTKALGSPESQYGLSASPVIWNDLVIIQVDQAGSEDNKSALLAFDLANGRERWRTKRPGIPNSWSSPVLAKLAGRDQVLTTANPWVVSYDPATGKELWRFSCLGGDVAASAAISNGLVVVGNTASVMQVIKPDGSGDVTSSHGIWPKPYDSDLPDTVSPVADADLIAFISGSGGVTCLDAKTGAKVWDKTYEGAFWASPVLADGKLYLTDRNGLTRVLAWGRELKELSQGNVGEPVSGTPAIVGGRIYLRGEKHLFCIGVLPGVSP